MTTDGEYLSVDPANFENNALKTLSGRPSFRVLMDKFFRVVGANDDIVDLVCRACQNNKTLKAKVSYFGNLARHLEVGICVHLI